MDYFTSRLTLNGVLSHMKPELVTALREAGFVADCGNCLNSFFKSWGPSLATNCGCGQTIDHTKEAWAIPDYVAQPGGTIPTVDAIVAKLYHRSGEKAETVAKQLGLSRSAFYRLLVPGQPLPKRQTLLDLADICANSGMLPEAEALERYWSKQRRLYRLRGAPRHPAIDEGRPVPSLYESRAAERAAEIYGLPNPLLNAPPGTPGR